MLPSAASACGWPGDGKSAATARLELGDPPGSAATMLDESLGVAEMTALGHQYRSGRGVTASPRKAAGWYRRAAQLGDAEAQYTLALMLDTGSGISPNPGQARYWYRRAAAQGNVHAQHHLAEMLRDGRGERPDQNEAVSWFLRAAELGHVDVYGPLGRMYWDNPAVPRQPLKAYIWLSRAALSGDPGNDALLHIVEGALSKADRRQGSAPLN